MANDPSNAAAQAPPYRNPYRPGAGHMPPYLAGREEESQEFDRLLTQDAILENMVLTGLRGVGKTVLLDTFKPRAVDQGWLWVGTDLSESASVSEDALSKRLLTDLSVATSQFAIPTGLKQQFGMTTEPAEQTIRTLDYGLLEQVYDSQPGLVSDKLRAVMELVWNVLHDAGQSRLIFAYDEAQNLADRSATAQYPLSLLLDVFSSLQRRGAPFLLILTGLPTLFPKLVEARTYAERMFRVVTLARLSRDESRDAILKPLETEPSLGRFTQDSVEVICTESGGYPYFIQFICREVYDAFILQVQRHEEPLVPTDSIRRKLDSDFFAGRWAKATDRQRDLLWIVSLLDRPDEEFTIQELVMQSRTHLRKGFSSSHANQMLSGLANQGLVYKNRFGRYSFAVPLFGEFITRTYTPPEVDE